MGWICSVVIIGEMTGRARGRRGCVVSVNVASGAGDICMTERKGERAMVEGGRFPSRIGGVAQLAVGRELKGSMVWIRGALVILLVT